MARKGDYVGSGIQSKNMHLSRALVKIASEPTVVVKVVKERKPDPRILLTDEQVRAARRRHEIDGLRPREVAKEFGLTPEYAYALLNYQTRSKIYID